MKVKVNVPNTLVSDEELKLVNRQLPELPSLEHRYQVKGWYTDESFPFHFGGSGVTESRNVVLRQYIKCRNLWPGINWRIAIILDQKGAEDA